jgi:hypothetical protein
LVDFAVGVERGEVGVLEDLAIDRHHHAFLNLAPGVAAVELLCWATAFDGGSAG